MYTHWRTKSTNLPNRVFLSASIIPPCGAAGSPVSRKQEMGGDQYLANLGNPPQRLLDDLAKLRQQHLEAVANLLGAIDKGNVSNYLNHQFKCSK